jgi:hypothetical protein
MLTDAEVVMIAAVERLMGDGLLKLVSAECSVIALNQHTAQQVLCFTSIFGCGTRRCMLWIISNLDRIIEKVIGLLLKP